jgi:hypothetical protein
MDNTPNTITVSLTECVQREYLKAIDPHADIIGLDYHEVKFKGESIDSEVVKYHSAALFVKGQLSMIALFRDMNIIQANELPSYIKDIKEKVAKYTSAEKKELVALEEPNSQRINGSVILEEFHNSFYKGMCDIYDVKMQFKKPHK